MKWQVTVALVILTVLYAVIGGVIFHYLEKDNELRLHSDLLQKFKLLCSNGCINSSDVILLKSILSDMFQGGLDIDEQSNSLRNFTRWDLASSLFVSIQTLASIGFIKSAPASFLGRIFCSIFGALGVPLFFIAALTAGKLISKLGDAICKRSCGKIGKLQPQKSKIVFTIAVLIIGVLLFILVPASVFSSLENWTFGEAVYFCFMTLFTIGFSDFIPTYSRGSGYSESFRRWYRLGVSIWLILLVFWYGVFLRHIKSKATNFAEHREGAQDTFKKKVKAFFSSFQKTPNLSSSASSTAAQRSVEHFTPNGNGTASAEIKGFRAIIPVNSNLTE